MTSIVQVESPQTQTENKAEEPKQEPQAGEISENKPLEESVKDILVEALQSNGAIAAETGEETKGNVSKTVFQHHPISNKSMCVLM